MKVTVKELADMWRGAASSMRSSDDPELVARAAQLEACATDLESTKFHHELLIDPETKRKWWKIL